MTEAETNEETIYISRDLKVLKNGSIYVLDSMLINIHLLLKIEYCTTVPDIANMMGIAGENGWHVFVNRKVF